MQDKSSVFWFSIILFFDGTEEYIMLTHDTNRGHAQLDLSGFENTEYLDQHEYDGPESWADDLLDYLKNEFKEIELSFFDFNSPCYYHDDIRKIQGKWNEIIRMFNDEYISSNK